MLKVKTLDKNITAIIESKLTRKIASFFKHKIIVFLKKIAYGKYKPSFEERVK